MPAVVSGYTSPNITDEESNKRCHSCNEWHAFSPVLVSSPFCRK